MGWTDLPIRWSDEGLGGRRNLRTSGSGSTLSPAPRTDLRAGVGWVGLAFSSGGMVNGTMGDLSTKVRFAPWCGPSFPGNSELGHPCRHVHKVLVGEDHSENYLGHGDLGLDLLSRCLAGLSVIPNDSKMIL